MKHGATLLELLCSMAILSVLAGIAVPAIAWQRDRVSVMAAREALAAELERVRMLAVSSGGATLVLGPPDPRAVIRISGFAESEPVQLSDDPGLTLHVGVGASEVELGFDALGIGRFANRTITLRRGRAVAGITVSSYGRVRRW